MCDKPVDVEQAKLLCERFCEGYFEKSIGSEYGLLVHAVQGLVVRINNLEDEVQLLREQLCDCSNTANAARHWTP